MHEWTNLLKGMLPSVKFQQYLITPIDIVSVNFFQYLKLGVGITAVFVGGAWMALARKTFFKAFAKYFAIVMFVVDIIGDIIAAIEKKEKFKDLKEELLTC